MFTKEENELLVRVGPETPMGQMMRRYWVPACMSEEVAEPDCDPFRVRLLGEDLVAFRDTNGRVGLMDQLCPHRRAGLFLARNEEGGLRCLYHGWKIDVDGRILEQPCEPPDSTFKDRVRAKAYPTHEAGGLIWTYMGPREHQPPFPDFEWNIVPDGNRSIAKVLTEANYLQPCEGNSDHTHAIILHNGYESILFPPPNVDLIRQTRFDFADAPWGITMASTHDDQDDPDHLDYVSNSHFVFPFFAVVPPRGFGHVHLYVPIDDERTWDYSVYYSQTRGIDHLGMLRRRKVMPDVDLLPDRRRKRNIGNGLMQDRVAMREKRSFSGIGDNPHEDEGIQESMGPICDRWNEHLGTTDVCVINLRQRMLQAVRDFQNGGTPPGLQGGFEFSQIKAHRKLLPKGMPWQRIEDYAEGDLESDYAQAVATS
ncbi:MAG: phthalate 4,5-dioxygenase oxygenase subunit [Chloroflexi bacterium]|nr:phthalate 4,5-dioxygenase oxygenase subunit [Chloroflexota bacterium]